MFFLQVTFSLFLLTSLTFKLTLSADFTANKIEDEEGGSEQYFYPIKTERDQIQSISVSPSIRIPSPPSHEFLVDLMRPPSRGSPPFRQAKDFKLLPSQLSPRWFVSSSSLIDPEHFAPVVYAEIPHEKKLSLLLTPEFISRNPSIEFLFHRDDSFTDYKSYVAVNKVAFSAVLTPSSNHALTISKIINIFKNDFILDQLFVAVSFLNCGDDTYELIVFTNIEQKDYEMIDRVLHAFSRYRSLKPLNPTSAFEIIQKRLHILQSLSMQSFKLNGSPQSSRKNLVWNRLMNLMGNLPKSPQTVTIKRSPRGSPQNQNLNQRIEQSLQKCPLSIIDPKDLDDPETS